jgi:Homeodomain-like domain
MFAMTHPVGVVNRSLELAADGLSTAAIARRLDVPRGTVRDWLAGRLPKTFHRDDLDCAGCGGTHDVDVLPPVYVYLLGMYLGDGCLSEHRRSVYKLRISLDARYPGIAGECEHAIRAVMPRNRIGRVDLGTWQELYSYSKTWACLFPQHGPGKKHQRPIALTEWQRSHVERSPMLLLRGLIQSDGCRFQNTGRAWSHPRYSFANKSEDIKRIFCETCDLVGLHWTRSGEKTIYVSRKADVAILDRFVGPKG